MGDHDRKSVGWLGFFFLVGMQGGEILVLKSNIFPLIWGNYLKAGNQKGAVIFSDSPSKSSGGVHVPLANKINRPRGRC